MQPDVAQFHKTEPEMAEPATADFEAAEPGTARPVAVESAAPPKADLVHLATEKIQVPGFGAPPAAVPSDALVVLGMHCENHYFGDPEARSRAFCRVWKNRPGSIPETGPRPPLGALVLDDNSVLQLTADCVVGRDPALDPSVAAGQARPLCILDAQVSRFMHGSTWMAGRSP